MVRHERVSGWINQFAATPDGATVACSMEHRAAFVFATIIDPAGERAVAFWAGAFTSRKYTGGERKLASQPPLPAVNEAHGFLRRETLLYQSSPSGRTLLAHAAAQTASASFSSPDAWLDRLLSQWGGEARVHTLLQRDCTGLHALDHALARRRFSALKIFLTACLRLPAHARGGLLETYSDGALRAFEEANRIGYASTDRDATAANGADGGKGHKGGKGGKGGASNGGGASGRTHRGGHGGALRAHGSAGATNFLVRLAEVFPNLAADFLHHLGLDEYAEYDDAPTGDRLPLSELTMAMWWKYIDVRGHDSPHPRHSDLWEDSSHHAITAATSEAAARDVIVDVDCRLVGLGGLASSDRSHPQRVSTFTQLVSALSEERTFEHAVMSSAAMRVVIEHRWESFGFWAWRRRCALHALYGLSAVSANVLGTFDTIEVGPFEVGADEGDFPWVAAAIFGGTLAINTWLCVDFVKRVRLLRRLRSTTATTRASSLLLRAAMLAMVYLLGVLLARDLMARQWQRDVGGPAPPPAAATQPIAAVTLLLIAMQAVPLARGQPEAGFFISLLGEAAVDLLPIASVTLFFLTLFGVCMAVLAPTSDEFGGSSISAGLHVLMVLINNFEPTLYEPQTYDARSVMLVVFLALFVFGLQLFTLNLVIASMGDTLDRVTDTKVERALRARAVLLCDVEYLLSESESASEAHFPLWLHVRVTRDDGSDAASGRRGWSGRVGAISRKVDGVDRRMAGQLAELNEKLEKLRGLVGEHKADAGQAVQVRTKLTSLDEQLASLSRVGHDQSQRLDALGENLRSVLRRMAVQTRLLPQHRRSTAEGGAEGGGAEGVSSEAPPSIAETAHGTLLIDVGSGEVKLLAGLCFVDASCPGQPAVEIIECAVKKRCATASVALALAEQLNFDQQRARGGRSISSNASIAGREWRELRAWLLHALEQHLSHRSKAGKIFQRARKVEWETGALLASEWKRRLHAEAQEQTELFLQELRALVQEACMDLANVAIEIKTETLTEADEARYELLSVEHAMRCASVAAPPAPPTPPTPPAPPTPPPSHTLPSPSSHAASADGAHITRAPPVSADTSAAVLPALVMSAGKGSIKLVARRTPLAVDAPYVPVAAEVVVLNLPIPLDQGVQLLRDGQTETWRQQLQQRLAATPMVRKRDELLRCCASAGALRIVAIGSWYYAAVAAGIVRGKETRPRYVPCGDVLRLLQARAEDCGTEMRSDDDIEARANTLRSRIVLEWLLNDGAQPLHVSHREPHVLAGTLERSHVLFVRDWKLPRTHDEVSGGFSCMSTFRATAPAGWWVGECIKHEQEWGVHDQYQYSS